MQRNAPSRTKLIAIYIAMCPIKLSFFVPHAVCVRFGPPFTGITHFTIIKNTIFIIKI